MADAVEKLEAEVRKLAAAMKRLAADQAEHRRETAAIQRQVIELETGMDIQFEAVKQELTKLHGTSQAMAEAMLQAIKQLGVDKSVEARVARLEAAVFGHKH